MRPGLQGFWGFHSALCLILCAAHQGCGSSGPRDAVDASQDANEGGLGQADDLIEASDSSGGLEEDTAATPGDSATLPGDIDGIQDGSGPGEQGAPSISFVEPNHTSARGGEVITLRGASLWPALAVSIGGVPAAVLGGAPDALQVEMPPLWAGSWAVEVQTPQGSFALASALQVEALELNWVIAPLDTIESPAAPNVRAAAAFDVDSDGDLDVVLATSDGLRLLLNDGGGHYALAKAAGDESELSEPLRPGGSMQAHALTVIEAEQGDRWLAVARDGAQDLLFRGGPSGLEAGPPLPARPGNGRDIVAADLDGDGVGDIVALWHPTDGGAPWIAGYLQRESSFVLFEALTPGDPHEFPVGFAESTDSEAALAFTRVPAGDQGGFARAQFELTEAGPEAAFGLTELGHLDVLPVRLSFRVRGGEGVVELRARLVDAQSRIFHSPPLLFDPDTWTMVVATGVSAWSAQDGSEGAPALPLHSVALVATSFAPLPLTGDFETDDWSAELPDGKSVLLADFDARIAAHSAPGVSRIVAGDVDGDGVSDVVGVGLGVDGVYLWRTNAPKAPGAFWHQQMLSSAGSTAMPWQHAAAVWADVDGDGDLDLVKVGDTQDRLFVGDGWGQFVDATEGSLPLDSAKGRSVAARDMDRDGAIDLVVGNDGATDRLYLGRGDGRFVDSTPLFGFDSATTAVLVVVDVDGDGDDDVISVPADGGVPRLRIAVDAPKEANR